jgi:hypothetical protein
MKAAHLPTPPSQEGSARKQPLMISLSMKRYDQDGKELEPPPSYKTDIEISLAAMLSTPPGMEPLPLFPPGMEEGAAMVDEVARTLENKLVITENEDSHSVQTKEAVAWAKVGMKDALTKGHSVGDYIKAVYEQMYGDAQDRQQLLARLSEFSQANDKIVTLEALKDVNARLAQENLPLIEERDFMDDE